MLQPFPVVLAGYNPEWRRLAADYAGKLATLGPLLVAVHHIGSTSVPGLAAKPIIDLMPVVAELEAFDALQTPVEALGFMWHGEYGISGRRYCTCSNVDGRRVAQLHVFAQGSPHIVRHLAFRDYLRKHSAVAAAYEAEKRRARDMHPGDSHAYTDAKADWIRQTEVKALAWYVAL